MNKYYAVVDEFEDVPGEQRGTIVQKIVGPPFRDRLCVLRLPPEVISGVIVRPETCVVATPDKQGIYMLREADGHMEAKMTAMEVHKKRHPFIIGPFNSHPEARLAQERERPKTEHEKMRAELEELRAMRASAKPAKKDKTPAEEAGKE